jgi:hypothetical protein
VTRVGNSRHFEHWGSVCFFTSWTWRLTDTSYDRKPAERIQICLWGGCLLPFNSHRKHCLTRHLSD